jgi:hypothetical protein
MKGFIWHSPGFFSSPDLSNPQDIPPVCLCSGTVDFVSIVQANILNGAMSNAGFPYLYNQISGVDHTMEYPAFTQEMLGCINFIDANTSGLGITEWTGSTVSMFPNPLNEGQELILTGLEGNVTVSVLNASGKLVWNRHLINGSNRITISDFRNELAVGLYTVSILSKQGSLTKKLVVR